MTCQKGIGASRPFFGSVSMMHECRTGELTTGAAGSVGMMHKCRTGELTTGAAFMHYTDKRALKHLVQPLVSPLTPTIY